MVVAVCHGGARILWWLLFVTEEHGIVRSERDVMIGGVLGRVEVRRSPKVGLMAETTTDGALVFFFCGLFFFFFRFISSLKAMNLEVLLFFFFLISLMNVYYLQFILLLNVSL